MSDEPYVMITLPFAAEGKRAHNSRVAFKGGKPFVMHYPDPATVKHESMISDYARLAMIGKAPLHATAVSIAIEAHFVPPVSWTKRQTSDALTNKVHLAKPDWDNIAKSACDALKGIVWDDDSRVVLGQVVKEWAEEPMLRITVWRYLETVPESVQESLLVGDFE